jgi:spermidine synthase
MSSAGETRRRSRLGTIRLIRRKRTGTLTYLQRGGYQSQVDADGTSLASYIHALYGLALQRPGRRLLMIGCGGGTLATMLDREGFAVTVVDIDPAAVALARRHFGLPATVRAEIGDGLRFLQRTRRRFDILVVDAFVGERVPPQFLGEDFCQAAGRVLRPDGTLLFNVCLDTRRDRTADDLALALRRSGWKVRILDDHRAAERNAIVLGGAVGALRRPRLRLTPRVDEPRLRRELAALRFRRVHTPK